MFSKPPISFSLPQITSSISSFKVPVRPHFHGSLKNNPFRRSRSLPKAGVQAGGLQSVARRALNGPLTRRRMSRVNGTGSDRRATDRTAQQPERPFEAACCRCLARRAYAGGPGGQQAPPSSSRRMPLPSEGGSSREGAWGRSPPPTQVL